MSSKNNCVQNYDYCKNIVNEFSRANMKPQFRSKIVYKWQFWLLCNPSEQSDFFGGNFSIDNHSLYISPALPYLLLLFREFLCLVLIIIIVDSNAFNFKNNLIITVIILWRVTFTIDFLLDFFESHKQDTNQKVQQKERTK